MSIRKIIKKATMLPKDIGIFLADLSKFRKYSTSYNAKSDNIEYVILYYAHAIEKGLSIKKNKRPFGYAKVQKLTEALDEIDAKNRKQFAYRTGLSALFSYKRHYEANGFTDSKEYKYISDYLVDKTDPKIGTGTKTYTPTNTNSTKNYLDFLTGRHSVRSFKKECLSDDKIQYATKCAAQTPSACNRQMVKASLYRNGSEEVRKIAKYAKGIGGFDTKTLNFIVITFDLCSTMSIYERSQGYFNAGLFSTNLINALHEEGIGSCFIQWANNSKDSRELKNALAIPDNEQIAVLIACGPYKDEYEVPSSVRKSVEELLRAKNV